MVETAAAIVASDPNGAALERPMLADLRRQPACLAALLERHAEFSQLGRARFGARSRRIVAFGSGDGWFAARCAADYAQIDLGLSYVAASSLETLSYVAPRFAHEDLAGIAISMSGSADRTNEAAEALRAAARPVLALTNGSGGPLAGIADAKISLNVADLAPFLTGTTKYTATLLGLLMLLEGASETGTRPDWPRLLATLPAMVELAERFAEALVNRMGGRPPTGVRILSAGPNLATAEYGMAKLIKLLPVPVWADEIEEFAHRQFWSCPATDLVVYVATNPRVARCAAASAAALGSMGMMTAAVDLPGSPVTGTSGRFTLPEIPERLSPLFAAIPLQFIGYFLARALGATPDKSQDVADPARFRAAQLLARRGELTPEATSPA
jgi:glucosamine 6-phosphate synthetase-like amidotransferase/phosphosugar isomerase protein